MYIFCNEKLVVKKLEIRVIGSILKSIRLIKNYISRPTIIAATTVTITTISIVIIVTILLLIIIIIIIVIIVIIII